MPSVLTSLIHLVLLTSSFVVTSSCPSDGATENLAEVLMGRCVEYKTLINPEAVCSPPEVNCTEAVASFIHAFAGRPPCDINVTRYDAFLSATRHDFPANMSLFWHGVYGEVHKYSQRGQRKATLEDTLTGYMVDGLSFCSDPSKEGGIGTPDSEFCPNYDETGDCPLNAESSFWSAASKDYASKARGTISIMLNASTGDSYSDTSYFGRIELPNLNSDAVTYANIWLVSKPGDVIIERCDSDNIKLLQSRLRDKCIDSTCTFNPKDVFWMLCWDNQDAKECQSLVTSGSDSVSIATSFRLCLLLALLVSWFF